MRGCWQYRFSLRHPARTLAPHTPPPGKLPGRARPQHGRWERAPLASCPAAVCTTRLTNFFSCLSTLPLALRHP